MVAHACMWCGRSSVNHKNIRSTSFHRISMTHSFIPGRNQTNKKRRVPHELECVGDNPQLLLLLGARAFWPIPSLLLFLERNKTHSPGKHAYYGATDQTHTRQETSFISHGGGILRHKINKFMVSVAFDIYRPVIIYHTPHIPKELNATCIRYIGELFSAKSLGILA